MPELSVADRLASALARLNPEQREAASINGGYALVLAPAGTGKTETMAVRVARLIWDKHCVPHEVLGLTFTAKAAREFRTRIGATLGRESMPTSVGTFHTLALGLLRERPALAGLKAGFEIADEDKMATIVKAAMVKNGHPTKRKGRYGADPVKAVADKFARLKDDGFRPTEAAEWLARYHEEHADDAAGLAAARIAADIAPLVQAGLRRRNLCDFADMVLWPTLALESDPELRQHWSGRFRHVVVDEYQDVNDIQYRFAKASASVHGNLMVVGDDDQCVHEWRGAKPAYILRFQEDFPGAVRVTLHRNYRSTQPILDAASRLIAHNASRHEKAMVAADGADGPPPAAIECRDTAHEADTVVRAIVSREPDIELEQCAVLYRSAWQGRAIEDALRKQGVGYGVVGGVSFYRRREIGDALALLVLAEGYDSPASDDAFRRVVNVPPRGVGPVALKAVTAEAERLGASMFVAAQALVEAGDPAAKGGLASFMLAMEEANFVQGGPDELLATLLDATGYHIMLDSQGAPGRERRENLDELGSLAGRFADSFTLVEHCTAAAIESEAASEFGRVQLTTIHGAKGLEYDFVAVVGCAEDAFPSARSVKEGRLEEERRLAYVALTRARRACMLTWPRRGDGRRTASEPSRFIAEAGMEAVRLQEAFKPPRRKSDKKSAPKRRPTTTAAAPRATAAPVARGPRPAPTATGGQRPALAPLPGSGDSPKAAFWGKR